MELGTDAESQAKEIRNEVDNLTAALDKKIGEIDARTEVHGQKIEGLESSMQSNATRISELASTSESQGKEISEPADTCATCYHFSRNQSRNAHHEMQCQNGQCPDQPWLGWLTGIGSTFALFLLHSVSF